MAALRKDSVDLDAHHRELAAAIRDGRVVPAGRLLGLPDLPDDDVWVDVAGASAISRVSPKTITSWLARGGPKRLPYPYPHRFLYRLYWRRSEVERWIEMEKARP